jgi:transposase
LALWRLQAGAEDGRDSLMLAIHPNARTTPAVRAEIARSAEPTGELAKRFGVSTETIRKWRKRGPTECRDRSSRPHRLPWKASEEERAIVCAMRRATGFPLDDLTFVVAHFLPHLGRDNVYRILKAAGLSRRPALAAPERAAGKFKEYELGFVHMDVKHLPKLRTADGELRKRFLFVAIDRRSRSVHLAVKNDETEASARAFLGEALAAFPFQVTHVLTDRGSCFTADGFEKLCRELGVEHRKIRPYTPRTNGLSALPTSLRGIGQSPMAERFNGRVQREVLGITVASHGDLERLLAGFNSAYNARRQRVLDGRSPEEVVRERLAHDQGLANADYRPPSDPCTLPKAMLVIERAKDVSQPDS